jgi:PAS domain S-box-containing protein
MTANGPVRILIADDHEIVRQGIRSLFDLQTDWEICGEAVDGLDAIEKSKHLKPDVILLDVSMPHLNGLDAARVIRKEVPESKILIVSQHDAAYMSQRALEVGARGYVAKSELSRQLLAAVESVINDGKPAAVGADLPPQKSPPESKTNDSGASNRATTPPQPKEQPSLAKPSVAEKRPRAKDRQFQSMADTVPAMIWISGANSLPTYFNKRWLEFTGRTLEQELGNGWGEGVHPDDRQRTVDTYLSAFRSRQPYKMEYRLRRADGQFRWILSHGVPRIGDEEEFEGYVGSCVDIAEQKTVEEIRSRLAAIVESSEDAIVSKDFGGIITSWNASAERIFGYTEKEVVGKSITLIIPPELRGEEAQILQRLRTGERVEHFETERLTKDRKRITVSLTISPIRDATGKLVGASKTARDVTQLRQVEAALRESEQRLRFSLEAANFGTWNWNIPTGKVQWSENMERIHGQAPGSFAGNFESFVQCIREEDRNRVQQAIQRALAGDGKYHTEYRQVREDGTVGWMEARGQVIRDDSGRPVRLMGVCMDVSERKRAEEALKQAREELEGRVTDRTAELERAQERLRALSGRLLRMQDDERRRIARELHDTAGQILVALNLNLVPLEEELAERATDLVKPVKECLSLVDELSRDLRTISHLLHPPLLDEAGLPSALRWFVEGFSERSKVKVELHLAEDLGRLPAECETAIFRMVQECLTNIHRHSESNTASISITHDAQSIKVEIRDQGKGMPMPMPRAGVGIQGMGERIRQLGGSLEIESGSQGTSVVAILPANRSSSDTPVETVDVAS